MIDLISLPTEILREIIIHVFLNDQDLPNDQDNNIFNDFEEFQLETEVLLNYTKSKLRASSFAIGMLALHGVEPPKPENFDQFKDSSKFTTRLYDDVRNSTYVQRGDLVSLSLTCHYLHGAVERILWKMVEPSCQEGTQGRVDFGKILCPIYRRPELGTYVKGLSFRYIYVLPDVARYWSQFYGQEEELEEVKNLDLAVEGIGHLVSASATIEEIYDFIQCWTEEVQISALFSLLPNLTALNITIQDLPDLWKVFHLRDLTTPFPSTLQNLTELSIVFEGFQDPFLPAYDYSYLMPLFLLPNLETLYFGRLRTVSDQGISPGQGILPEQLSEYYHKSKVRKLILDFCNVDTECSFEVLLRLPEKLEMFVVRFDWENERARGWNEPRGRAGFGGRHGRRVNPDVELARCLLPQGEWLMTLEVRTSREVKKGREVIPVDLLPSFSLL